MTEPTITPSSTTEMEDRGTILVLVLLLTVVLAIVALALAGFATVGLKTSNVATQRTESNSVASAGMFYVIEELSKKNIRTDTGTPGLDCSSPTPLLLSVPPSVLPDAGSSITIECTLLPVEIDNHPTVELNAVGVTPEGVTRRIDVVAQVPRDDYTVQVYSWTAD